MENVSLNVTYFLVFFSTNSLLINVTDLAIAYFSSFSIFLDQESFAIFENLNYDKYNMNDELTYNYTGTFLKAPSVGLLLKGSINFCSLHIYSKQWIYLFRFFL